MSRSKLLIMIGLVLLMTVPVSIAQAQQATFPGSGTAVISDGVALSDRITYTMTGLRRLGPEEAYEGWLVDSRSGNAISTGVMRLDAAGAINHTYTSPDGQNLIANYDTVTITVEPVPDPDPGMPSDVRAFSHRIPGPAMTHIRHLLVSWPEGSEAGIMTNLKNQLDLARDHARLASNSADLDGVRTHTHHVINIIEGEGGPNFDGSFGNPGDGIGVLAHAQDRRHAGFASQAAPGDQVIANFAAQVEMGGQNAENWAIEARDMAMDLLAEDRIAIARTLMNQVTGRLDAARLGIPATNTDGARQAYISAQRMATFTLPSPQPTAPTVGDVAVPLLAQMALAGALVLLASGGFLLYRERRTRKLSV